jgi:CcmD family protein
MIIPITAYILVWLAIYLYLVRLHVEQRRLSRELERMQSQLEKRMVIVRCNEYLHPNPSDLSMI